MRLWPFKEKPDTRPATAAAIAVAKSLREEPQRWKNAPGEDRGTEHYLIHDSGIVIGVNGFIWRPDLVDEPSANGDLVSVAVDDWVAATLTASQSSPAPQAEVAADV